MKFNSLKVCIIGEFSPPFDEGMKNVAKKTYDGLSNNNETYKFDLKKIYDINQWIALRKFKPQIILYVPGPSTFSFILAKFTSLFSITKANPQLKIIVLTLQPRLFFPFKKIYRFISPDLVLCQSDFYYKLFKKYKFKTKYLPLGVNTDCFYPVNYITKKTLRKKHDIQDDAFVVLHVGSIRNNRNLEICNKIQKMENIQVIIIGSTSSAMDMDVFNALNDSGCLVWRKYMTNIDEIYKLSDLYIFPVVDRLGCIDIPLSILEAMATNLPIITTKYGGLPKMFTYGENFIYIDDVEEIPHIIKSFNKDGKKVFNREQVLKYTWKNTISLLNEYMHSILRGWI